MTKYALACCLFFAFISLRAATITSTTGGGNWSSTLTWNGGNVPGSGDNVVINGPVTLDISTTVISVTINSGATVSLSLGSNTLSLSGTGSGFTNNGSSATTFNAGTGTVDFTGNKAATISGSAATTFYNLTISNANNSGVTINIGSGTQTVLNLLTLSGKTLTTNSLLSLSSGATITISSSNASLSAVPSGGPWDVIYNLGGNFTTTSEVTSTSGLVSSVTCQSGNVSCGGAVSIGSLIVSSGATFVAPSTTLTLTADLTIDGTYTSNLGTLAFNGTSTITDNFAGGTPFYNISINGGASVALGSDINVQGTSFINSAATGDFTTNSYTVIFNGSKALTVSGTDCNFDYVTVNNTKNVTLSSPQTITTLLTLTAGSLINGTNLSMPNNATISRASNTATLSATPLVVNSGDLWNIVYAGSASISTGVEIPSTGNPQVLSITSTNTGTTTLTQPVILSSLGSGFQLNAAGGAFTCGANSMTAPSVAIAAGTFTAPSSTLTITTGSLQIFGTYTHNAGTLVFSGASQSINGTGAAGTTYNSITINSGCTFTSPSTLTLAANLTNGGTFSGATTVTATGNFQNAGAFTPPTTMTLQGNFTNNSPGTFNSGASATINFTGVTQTVSGSGTTLFNNFVNNKNSGSTSVNASATITIKNLTNTKGTLNLQSTTQITSASTSVLTLTAGTINVTGSVSMSATTSNTITLTAGTLAITGNLLSLANGTQINIAAGAVSTSSPSGGPWKLSYSGAAAYTTAFEIPSSGAAITSLTSNKSGTLNLGSNVTASSGIAINSGTLVDNARTITLSGGDFSISGTYTATGTVVFSSSSSTQTISGTNATTTNFNNITNNNTSTNGLSAPASLTVLGTLLNNGNFTHNNGTVTFCATTSAATATIGGSTKIGFYNISVANGTNGTDLILENSAGADLTNMLSVGTATFDADGASNNRIFTLLSSGDTPTVDASIAAILSGGAINGSITVQRYLKYAGNSTYYNSGWRDISSPVNTTVSDLKATLPITGTFNDPSNVTMNGTTDPDVDNSIPSMVYYDESVITDTSVPADGTNDLNDGFVNFPPNGSSTTSTSFTMGRGYSIYIYGSDDPFLTSVGNNHATYSLRGPLWSPTGTSISLPVSLAGSGGGSSPRTVVAANDGWNLVGNPYPSTIDLESASFVRSSLLDNSIYIDDYSTTNARFAYYVIGTGQNSNGGSRYISSGQSFWMHATAATDVAQPSLTISEGAKAPGQSTIFFRTSPPPNTFRATLTSSDQMEDETVIYFDDFATAGFDSKYDARKVPNPYGFNLSSVSSNQKFAINGMSFSNCNQSVSLDVSDLASGTYTLSFSDFESMPSSMGISLKDNFNNVTIDIRQTQNYGFDVDQDNLNTFGATRFSILFAYSATPPVITAQTQSICDPSLAQITVSNTATEYSYSVVSPTDGSTIAAAVAGTGNDLIFSIPSSKVVAGSNQFQVKQVNKYCGTLASTSNVSLSYIVVPSAPVGTSGQSCGAGTVTLSASGAPTDGHYAWYDAVDATTALTSQTASFTTESISKDKTYYVAAINSLGCEGQRTAVTAKVVVLTQPTITVLDLNTLQADYDTGIQWYLNNQPIAGATSKNLTATQSGLYKLVVTSQGCTASVEKQFAITGVENVSNDIRVYPNPVKGTLSIEVQGKELASGALYNVMGESLNSLSFTSDGVKQNAVHTFSGESSGVYFVKINQGSKVTVVRIVKE